MAGPPTCTTGTVWFPRSPPLDTARWFPGCEDSVRPISSIRRRSAPGSRQRLASDLRDFMDALGVTAATLVGYDWGGRAACVVAALWPQRVIGLVSITGYNIQNIRDRQSSGQRGAGAALLVPMVFAHRAWRRGTCARSSRDRTAALAPVVAELDLQRSDVRRHGVELRQSRFRARYHSILSSSLRQRRWRPAFDDLERSLASQPAIGVPTIVLHGDCDGVVPPIESEDARRHFGARYERRVIPVAGHFLSREVPDAVVQAILTLVQRSAP